MNELLQIYGTLPHANSLVNGLLESMFDRFNGMLQFVNFSTAMGPSLSLKNWLAVLSLMMLFI